MGKPKQQKKAKVEFSLEAIRGNTVLKQQLEGFIDEIVICLKKIAGDREAVSDIRNEAKDSLGIPGRMLNKLVRENMEPGTIEAEVHELEKVQDIANVIEGVQPEPETPAQENQSSVKLIGD